MNLFSDYQKKIFNCLKDLAKKSFTKGRMDNNVIDLATDDVLGILKELYSE